MKRYLIEVVLLLLNFYHKFISIVYDIIGPIIIINSDFSDTFKYYFNVDSMGNKVYKVSLFGRFPAKFWIVDYLNKLKQIKWNEVLSKQSNSRMVTGIEISNLSPAFLIGKYTDIHMINKLDFYADENIIINITDMTTFETKEGKVKDFTLSDIFY